MIAALSARAGTMVLGTAASVLFGVALILSVMIWGVPIFGGGLKADLAASERQTEAERTAHVQTIQNYNNAQAEAARMEAARNARVADEQQRIDTNVVQDKSRNDAAIRARYERLLQQARAANGAPGGERVPGFSEAAAGTISPANQERLLGILFDADRQVNLLEAIWDWNEQQAAVPIGE